MNDMTLQAINARLLISLSMFYKYRVGSDCVALKSFWSSTCLNFALSLKYVLLKDFSVIWDR